MNYGKECASNGDYQYIVTGNPAPGDIVVPWWEVELARKEQRIAELEKRIAELEAQSSKIAKPVELPERMTTDEIPIFNRSFDD